MLATPLRAMMVRACLAMSVYSTASTLFAPALALHTASTPLRDSCDRVGLGWGWAGEREADSTSPDKTTSVSQ